MTSARYLVGDVRDVLASLPDDSVDLVMTSPPFLALRSYLPADHPHKALEIGSEPTPGEFIDTLLDVTEALDRVLAPYGSLVVELGDTYAGSGGGGGDYGWDRAGIRAEQNDNPHGVTYRRRGQVFTGSKAQAGNGRGWPLDKSLTLVPELYRFALAYGFNPLTGRQTPRWRVRNVVRWHRPNPPVGALGDKFRPSTSDLVVACKSRSRYFDLDAVRTEYGDRSAKNAGYPTSYRADPAGGYDESERTVALNPAGAPPLDTWIIPTQPYKGSHYATFPDDLVVIPVKSMCPHKVCRVCGEPSRRTFSDNPDYAGRGGTGIDTNNNAEQGASLKGFRHVAYPPAAHIADGWTDCGHDDYRAGVVLDPFAGSGTTLGVAVGHGRDAIGIDLDARNADLARERVGMWLTVETPEAV